MALTFCSFASGSSGNCYLVKSESTAILVDSGISGRRIFQCLKNTNTDPDSVTAMLITHEHHDHIMSLQTINKRIPKIRVYASGGTWRHINSLVDENKQEVFETGKSFFINDIEIKPFLLSHDAAEPVGFAFRSGEKQLCILTDTGCIDERIYREIEDADLLVLEANHDVEMLRMGRRYPFFLKQRILGAHGHLSNVDAAETICRLLSGKKKERHVLLAHLSRENNFPEMAYLTVKNRLAEKDFYIGAGFLLSIIARDEMSLVYTL